MPALAMPGSETTSARLPKLLMSSGNAPTAPAPNVTRAGASNENVSLASSLALVFLLVFFLLVFLRRLEPGNVKSCSGLHRF